MCTSKYVLKYVSGVLLWVVLLVGLSLVCCGCSGPVDPEPTVVTVWFEEVPLERYSRSADDFIAIEPRAKVTPDQPFQWCLSLPLDPDYECGRSEAGEIGGHRWYLQRDQNWMLRFRAWTADGTEGKSAWWWLPGLGGLK